MEPQPQHNQKIEERVLSAVLWNGSNQALIFSVMKPFDFYFTKHRETYQLLKKTKDDYGHCDLESCLPNFDLAEFEKARTFLTYLMSEYLSDANAPGDMKLLLEIKERRDIVRTLKKSLYELEKEEKSLTEIENHIAKKIQISRTIKRKQMDNISNSIGDILADVASDEKVPYIKTGFGKLDTFTSGFKPGEIIILAGRPGQGKSTLAMNWTRNICIFDEVPTSWFSMEMTKKEILINLLSNITGIDAKKIRDRELNEEEISRLKIEGDRVRLKPLLIKEGKRWTPTEIKMDLEIDILQHGIKIAFIDHVQLMKADSNFKNLYEIVTDISRNLKTVAIELNIPIVVLCQVSREANKRKNKPPELSDLKQSGAIEEDADVVIFIQRQGEDATLTIAKQRNGETGMIGMTFKGNTFNFKEYLSE